MAKEKEYYNISSGEIGTSHPGELIKEELTDKEVTDMLAAGLISEKHPLGKEEISNSKDIEIATLKGQLIEAKAATEQAKADGEKSKKAAIEETKSAFAAEKSTLEKKVADLTTANAELVTKNKELKKLAGV